MLRNGNFFLTHPIEVSNSRSSIPIVHSVQMKETHNIMNHLLPAVNYQEHK